MPSVINIAILVASMGPSRLQKNYFGRLTLYGPYERHNRRTVLQDAEKGRMGWVGRSQLRTYNEGLLIPYTSL